jgi:hypothetical protein
LTRWHTDSLINTNWLQISHNETVWLRQVRKLNIVK